MSPRKPVLRLTLFLLAMLMALSCRFVSDGPEVVVPTAPPDTPTAEASFTPQPTWTGGLPAPSETHTAVVVATFTATREAYPGPQTTTTMVNEPYPGPQLTATSATDPYPGPAGSATPVVIPSPTMNLPLDFTPTLTPEGSLTPIPSATPVFVPTFTPTLPSHIDLTGLWYGWRRIEIKYRDCEESIVHNLRWRIVQDSSYNLLVNDDLSGWLNIPVVVLSGTEYFEGGTLELTYILTVGPTRHELSGYFYGKARLKGVCGRPQRTQVNVPDGSVDMER